MKAFLIALLALLAFSAPMTSRAQTAPLIIDQSRPDRSPAAAATPGPPSPHGPGRVEAAPAAFTPFILREVRVQGSTASPDAVGSASQPYIGKTVGAADLRMIAEAIGAAYASTDIALYTVLLPRQTFEGGVVRVIVVEGYIADIALTSNDPEHDLGLTRSFAEQIKAEKPLRRSTLQRYIGLMRDIPGATVDVQLLQAGPPGAVRLALNVKHRRWQSSLNVNNRGSTYLGRTQIEATATLNGALREGERTRLTVAFPTELKRFRYVSLAHTEPLGPSGATLNLSVGRLETKPKIAGFELSGTAVTGGAQVSYPLLRSDTRNIFLTGGIDGLNSDNALFGQMISSERTRVLRLAASYGAQQPKQAVSASITLSQGVDGLGARMADPLTDAAFRKVNMQAGLNRQVGSRVAVRLAAGAQYAHERLPASEQFTFGGAQFGRAFASAVAVGDSGIAGSAELAWRPAKGLPKVVSGSEFYGFADAGHVTMRAAGGFPGRSYNLSSAGGGVRLAVMSKGVIELEASKALKDPVTGSGKPWRLMLSLRSNF